MPKLAEHTSTQSIKLLNIGDSGTGKTGALAELARAGYNLHIIDFDNGLDILATLLRDDPEALARVEYETFTNKMKKGPHGPIPVKADAFGRALKTLDSWDIYSMTEKDVIVIDSLTFMGQAALNYVLFMEGKAGQRPQIQHWGAAMSYLEDVLTMLTADEIKANVIINSHITFVEGENGGVIKGYPSALGSKLPPKVGRWFNTVVLSRSIGSGANRKREILTRGEGLIECKTAAFKSLPDKLPLETGLLEIINQTTGKTNG